MDVVQLKEADEAALADINALLKQLSERISPCSMELLTQVLQNPTSELWVVKDGPRIVGMGQLAITLKPEGIIAQMEDVVVDEGQRGKGFGKKIGEKLIERARARGARVMKLSSKPSRVAANALYQKLGFSIHETNSYYLDL